MGITVGVLQWLQLPPGKEAVCVSLFRATTVTGRGHTVEALPIEKTLEILRRHAVLKN
jgi:hypothetical protein